MPEIETPDPACPTCGGTGAVDDGMNACPRCHKEWSVRVYVDQRIEFRVLAWSQAVAEERAWQMLGGEWGDNIDDFEPWTQNIDVTVVPLIRMPKCRECGDTGYIPTPAGDAQMPCGSCYDATTSDRGSS